MRLIRVWVYDGILASTVAGAIDVFAVANALWANENQSGQPVQPLFSWRTESVDGKPVQAASGQMIAVDGKLGARAAADAVIVVGPFVGGGVARFLDNFERLLPKVQALLPALRRAYARGAIVASACSGAFLVAEAGLLDGREATTHWGLADALQARYPRVRVRGAEVLTEQDRVLCSGAVTSYLNMALRLVERFAGNSIAAAAAKLLLIDTNRVSQASYRSLTVQAQQGHGDPLVAKAQAMLEQSLQNGVRVGDLAQRLAVSDRTLNRRFRRALGQTPIGYLQTLRIDYAKDLLETSALSVEAVGNRVGYGDLSTFRRLFKRETDLTPRDFQRRFARSRAA